MKLTEHQEKLIREEAIVNADERWLAPSLKKKYIIGFEEGAKFGAGLRNEDIKEVLEFLKKLNRIKDQADYQGATFEFDVDLRDEAEELINRVEEGE